MASRASHNKNNSAVKRILQEARELANDASNDYSAAPLEGDIFEWHCTIRGSPGTEFEGGLYHCRILLPSEYPFRPPSIMLLTPNGRFELNTKICISFTNYHEELWQPAWGVRTAIIGLQGFFPLKGEAAIGVGAIEYPVSERKRLATLSRTWCCPHCQQPNAELLPDRDGGTAPEDLAPVNKESTRSVEDPTTASSPPTTNQSPVEPSVQVEGPAALAPPHDLTHAFTPVAPEAVILAAHHDAPLHRSGPRPPLALDATIGVLLMIVFALVCRKIGISV